MTAIKLLLENLISEPYSEADFEHNKECWDKAEEMEKQQQKDMFVGGYLTRAMKKNKLPYGMRYMNKVAEIEEEAEIVYDKSEKTTKE